jgi:hypothetical protein
MTFRRSARRSGRQARGSATRGVKPESSNPVLANTEPEMSGAGQGLATRINDGEFDADLYPLMKTLRARWEVVEALSLAQAMANLQMGDQVRIKDGPQIKPEHRGVVGTIVERHHDAIVICLAIHGADPDHNHIRCTPFAVDKILTPS